MLKIADLCVRGFNRVLRKNISKYKMTFEYIFYFLML